MKEKISQLEEMRKARNTYQSVYMQFTQSGKYYNTRAFCFYEGEDGKYYDPRLFNKFGNNFLTFTVGNKKEVLKLLKKIRDSKLHQNVCTMFFIDRDYDKSIEGMDKDLYETPCYSIENLYVKKDCLIKILRSEFGISEIDSDYNKCLLDFDKRMDEFNQLILKFNALALLRRRKSNSNSNFKFGSVKTTHIANVKLEFVSKAERYEETIDSIINNLNVDEEEIEKAENELSKKGNYIMNFRGKNQLDFFSTFIILLKDANNKGSGYFSKYHNNVHINITGNRLSELSQYATTPKSLEEFMDKHKVILDTLYTVNS